MSAPLDDAIPTLEGSRDILREILIADERGVKIADSPLAGIVEQVGAGEYRVALDALFRSAVDTDSDSAGALIGEQTTVAWEDVLREPSELMPRCTIHPNLSAKAAISIEDTAITPSVSATELADAGETLTSGTWSAVTLTPSSLRAGSPLTRRIVQQASNDIVGQVRRNLLRGFALKLESMLIDYIKGGTGYQSVVGLSTANILTMVEKIEKAGLRFGNGMGAWVTTPTNMKTIFNYLTEGAAGANAGLARSIRWGEILSYPVIRKASITANSAMFFGFWKRAHIGLWKDAVIVIDKSSQAAKGQCIVRLHAEAAVAIGDKAAFGVFSTS